jgi:hypothetical protein
METIWELGGRGSSTVGSHYQRTDEDSTQKIHELLLLLVAAGCRRPINPITNPNLVYSHSYM